MRTFKALKKRRRVWKIAFIMISTTLDFWHNYEDIKIYPMSNLLNPKSIVMDNERVYVEDGTSIKLFDKKDFKFVKTIGRNGEGPGEFIDHATPQILSDYLLVSSLNKISYFSLSGNFVKEKRNPNIKGSYIRAIKDKYVGYVLKYEQDDFYVAYVLYDSDFKPLKELHRGKAMIHKNTRRELFEIHFFDTYNDKIVVAQRNGLAIDIFNSNGDRIHSIKIKAEPIDFTDKDRDRVIRYWRETGYNQWQINFLKEKTIFPSNYPNIHTCRLADGKIYVITYVKKGDRYKCLIYDINGKFLKIIYLPIHMIAPHRPYPFTISRNNFYQLIYNYKENRWELHVYHFD